jgi:hypothetical protein
VSKVVADTLNRIHQEYSRVVTTEEGKAFADSRGCLFVECSAKKGEGVNGAFDDLVNRVGTISYRGAISLVADIIYDRSYQHHHYGKTQQEGGRVIVCLEVFQLIMLDHRVEAISL